MYWVNRCFSSIFIFIRAKQNLSVFIHLIVGIIHYIIGLVPPLRVWLDQTIETNYHSIDVISFDLNHPNFPFSSSFALSCIVTWVQCVYWLFHRPLWKFNYNLLFVRKYFERDHEWVGRCLKCPYSKTTVCNYYERAHSTMTFHFSAFDCSPENWIAPKPVKPFSMWIVYADIALKISTFQTILICKIL